MTYVIKAIGKKDAFYKVRRCFIGAKIERQALQPSGNGWKYGEIWFTEPIAPCIERARYYFLRVKLKEVPD